MTSSSHDSGTDRVAEIASSIENENFSIIVNIQGDEPFVDPDSIDAAIQLMFDNPEIEISTLAVQISSLRDLLFYERCHTSSYGGGHGFPLWRSETTGRNRSKW